MTEYVQPTRAELDAYIAEAHRMRSEMIASFVRSLFHRPISATAQPA